MPRTWKFAPYDEARTRDLMQALRVAPLTAQVLAARGYDTPDAATAFLDAKMTDLHDPDDLPGVAEAAEKIVDAVKAGRRITIYGDYDVDGMTATSILWHCLKLENADVRYYIPCRMDEGYGLNSEALRTLHEEDPNQLVVSVDCGITAVAEAALAKELGLELIITDHHTMDDELPEACLVHPRLPGGTYPFGDLCGAGVAFKVAWAVCKRLGDGQKASPRMREFLKQAVSLAAIGTVADVVPLHGENRVLVRYGLDGLQSRAATGLRSLIEIAGIKGDAPIQADDDIGFKIGPRLNAAGRLGQARLAVELLTTTSAERGVTLAKYLDDLNKKRRTVETRIVKRAKQMVTENPEWESHRALVLAHHDWHPGVIGIVANRIAEHFEKPTVLISLSPETNEGQGSARSYAGFNLHEALAACSSHLTSFGGHAVAAGLRIAGDAIDAFRTDFNAFVTDNIDAAETEWDLPIDAEVRLADVTLHGVRELDRLGPFGQANDRPLFAATRLELKGPPKRMGEGGNHLSLQVRQFDTSMRAVAFGRGDWADEMQAANGPIDLCFAPSINRFRGRESVEMMIKDWQPSDA